MQPTPHHPDHGATPTPSRAGGWRRLGSLAGRLSAGIAVALVVLGGVEGLAHVLLGRPPPMEKLTMLSRCQVQADGDQAALACNADRLLRPVSRAHPGRPRVVVLGGSSMWEPAGTNVPDVLAALLPEVDVVNFAVSGMQTSSLQRIASDLSLVAPDLVVVYAGHNEYNRTVFSGEVSATRLWMLPVYGVIQHSWLHTWLAGLPLVRADFQRDAANVLTTEDDLALRLRPALDRKFRRELTATVELSPAPVVLCTLLRNPTVPPNGVLVAQHPACARHADMLTGAVQPAADKLAQVEADCGDNALSAWIRYRAARVSGDEGVALEAWRQSTALDALPLRAPTEADDIIRAVAADTGAVLVDFEAALGTYPPPALFQDTLHLNSSGARRVAEVLAPVLRRELAEASAR